MGNYYSPLPKRLGAQNSAGIMCLGKKNKLTPQIRIRAVIFTELHPEYNTVT